VLVLRLTAMGQRARTAVIQRPLKRPSGRRKMPLQRAATSTISPAARRCRAKFRRHFPRGFQDETYLAWERDYKWNAHLRWQSLLGEQAFRRLLKAGEFGTIASYAVGIEARTNLLFSFEKMALRDAVKPPAGAKAFALGLYDLLYGEADLGARFDNWCGAIEALPRRRKRVLSWPVATIFGFLAQPRVHFFLKPTVTRRALTAYGLPFTYVSRPNTATYGELLTLVRAVKRDMATMHPRDLIDIQSFLWVQGSDEYPD
jgi:hypothetical protein